MRHRAGRRSGKRLGRRRWRRRERAKGRGGLPAAHGEQVEAEEAPSSAENLPAKPPVSTHPTPCAHPKPLHHGKLTPKRSEPSRCVIASSWSKSCPRASLPGLHDSNGMKPYICFCTRGYPCLRANTHTHTGARLAGGAIGALEPPPSSASRLVLRMSSPLLAPLPLDHPPLRCPSSSKLRHVYGSRRPRAGPCVRACAGA